MTMPRIAFLLALFTLQDPVKPLPDFEVPGSGRLSTLLRGSKGVVLAFTAADCPVSKLYRPKLDRFEKEWREKGVKLVLVDGDETVAAGLGARRTTEAFLIDPARVLIYRGAVDDQYGIGFARDAATKNWLADAVAALLAGKPPPVATTEAPGCPIEPRAKPAISGPVTYHRDVAPILTRSCAECHRPGEVGPFPLLTYEDARRSARRIREAVNEKRMPPWHADPKIGEWENDRHLSPAQVETIVKWIDSGTPEGDPKDAPPPRKWPSGWAIGTPDAVYTVAKPMKIPAEGTVPYRYIFVPTDQKEDRWVQAMEVRPGARGVVHHILVFVRYPRGRAADQPAFDGGLSHGYFGVMVPGERPTIFPEGMAKQLPAGSVLVFQIHYTPNGKATEDRSQIGLIFAKNPAKQEVFTRGINNVRIKIPPGAPNHREEASFTFDHDARILSFLPHMHVRGKSFRYVAVAPDGKEETLLDVPAYDFEWQHSYRYKEPRFVKKGTKIRAIAHYDNSKNNPANPDPLMEVRFGDQTWNEMLIGFMDFVKTGE